MRSVCPGCAAELESVNGANDPYGGSSAACWAAYGVVMAREFSGQAHFVSHRLSVDAYMAQHPSRLSRAAVQSVWLHLVGLCLAFERQAPPKYIGRVLGLLSQERREYTWLPPPPLDGVTVCTVVDALSPGAHQEATERWAKYVWQAWSPHHAAIRAVIAALDPG